MREYYPLVDKYNIPIVVTGFEPVDLLQGILMVVRQLEKGIAKLENQYSRIVRVDGNPKAVEAIRKAFKITDREWRGIGNIPNSGYTLKEDYSAFDANEKFDIDIEEVKESTACIAGEILKGIKKPHECPAFGKTCKPEHPLGAPMVSSEGACAAYYHFSQIEV